MINQDEANGLLNLEKKLQECKINTDIKIQKPPTILSIKEIITSVKKKTIFTLGNFSCITGKQKTKKTFLLSLLTAAIIKGSDASNKLIGELPEKKKLVVYIDTEQSLYHSHICIRRIESMAGTKENFIAYNLRSLDPADRFKFLEYIFEKYEEKIGFLVIDGIADLISTINDELEATKLTTLLLNLTAIYNCHIVTILHQNKGNDYATGHIGSSVMKKAELVISVSKCKTDKNSSDIVCQMSRAEDFEPFVLSVNHEGIPFINSSAKKETNEEGVPFPDDDTPAPF